MKFMVGLRRGEYRTDEIDDFVDRWHTSDCEEALSSYLGMTYEEYAAWVEQRLKLEDLAGKQHAFAPPPQPSLLFRLFLWAISKLLPGP
jgi:hypothetical protein